MSTQVKQGYRLTEVGVIPEDWELSELSAVSMTSSGTTPARSLADRYYRNGIINWVKTLDLNNSEIADTDELVTQAALEETCLRVYPEGTVLIAMYGGFNQIGRTGLLRVPAAVNQAITAIQPKPMLYPEYLIAVLNYRVDYWKSVASSSRKDPNITSQDVRFFKISFPPIKEQRAIAAALSDMDALISGLDQLIAKKRDIKQAAMQQLLTGQQRLPGFSGEWEMKRLGNLARIQRGASPRPIDSPVWFDDGSSIGWVRISDVTRSNIFLRETTQRLSTLGVKHSRPVSRGSLIMSICATVGRPVITEIDTCIHDGFVVFDDLEVSKYFMYYALKFIEGDWSRHGQTGSQMNLNTGLIKSTEIYVPPSEEQTAIATILSDMDSELTILETSRDKARRTKQGMMQELLTGKIRIS